MDPTARSRQWLRLPLAIAMVGTVAACGTTVPSSATAGAGRGGTGLLADSGLAADPPTAANLDGSVAGSGDGAATASSAAGAAGTGTAGGAATMSGTSTGDSGAASSAGVEPAAAGGTDARAPVKIGFLVVDNSRIGGRSAGPDEQRGFKDLVDHLNRQGGLEGRRIAPEYYSIDGATSDAATHAARACAFFAQDKRVQLVIGKEWTHPALEGCLAEARIPHFDAGIAFNLDGVSQQKETPYYANATTIGSDRYESVRLPFAAARGWIKRGEKIGVMVGDCQPYNRSYEDIVLPAARRLGMTVSVQRYKCPEGAGDLADTVAVFKGAVLKFKSEGVTTVMAVTTAESVVWAFFASEAENQGYRPRYLVTSDAQPHVMATNSGALTIPPEQIKNVRGFGWKPIIDIGPKAPARTASQDVQRKLCLKMSSTAGNAITGSGTDTGKLSWYFDMCDTVLFVGKLLAATRGSVDRSALYAQYDGVAGAFVSAGSPTGRFNAPAGRRDAISWVTPFAYDGPCSCMKYDGQPVSVP